MIQYLVRFAVLPAVCILASCNKPEGCPYQYTMPNGTCKCDPGYTGAHCEIIEDSCLVNSRECRMNEHCVNGQCECIDGYTGVRCMERIAPDLSGEYKVVHVTFQKNKDRNFSTPGFTAFRISPFPLQPEEYWLIDFLDNPHNAVSSNDEIKIRRTIKGKDYVLLGSFNCVSGETAFHYQFVFLGDTVYGNGFIREFTDGMFPEGRGGPDCYYGPIELVEFKAVRVN